MSFWMRAGSLQVGPFKCSLDDLAFEFTVPFEDSEELMVANIIIYNLSAETRAAIRKNHPIILNAGYEGDVGVIFTGAVASCSHTYKGLEWVTKIDAVEAMDAWLGTKINKTYQAGTDAKSIVKDLLKILSMEVSRVDLAVNKIYPRGKVCNGPVRDQLREIVTSDCKSIFMIRHNQVVIRNPATGTNLGILLTPSTGLLQSGSQDKDQTAITGAQDTLKSQAQRAEESKSFKRECLLRYQIAPGDIVRIQDSTLNGDFIVKKGIHKGARNGDWKTILEEVVPA